MEVSRNQKANINFLREVRKIADKEPYKMPATIDDPAILDEIKEDLINNNILK